MANKMMQHAGSSSGGQEAGGSVEQQTSEAARGSVEVEVAQSSRLVKRPGAAQRRWAEAAWSNGRRGGWGAVQRQRQ